MGEQKSAVVVAFEKQQGFGRVAVDGGGELPFDATVARAKVEELVVGAKVEIEIGPSRIPGRTKVTKLWLAGTSPDVPDPAAGPPSRELSVGPYVLLLPGFWLDREDKVREKDGHVAYDAVVAPNVSFDLAIVLGAADDGERRASLVRTYVEHHAAARHATRNVSLEGAQFEHHRFEGSPALPAGAAHDVYVGTGNGDLVVFGFVMPTSLDTAGSFTRLFERMVATAMVRRSQAIARAAR
jgi:hypothetical protein